MAFPQTPLDVRTEIQVGGTWVDITADTYTRDPITISRGTADEGTGAEPSSCSLTLNNRAGKYSPRNPLSPYYGLIGRNTPLRVSVPGAESYLSLDGSASGVATTPDVAALDITGDIDIRIEATADWYATETRTLIGKWNSATNQRSYLLTLTAGALQLRWSPDGTSTAFVGQALPSLPKRAALRVTLDVNNGAGGWTGRVYWATSMAGPWNEIQNGAGLAGATSIFASTAPLVIAPTSTTIVPNWTPAQCRVHRAEVRSGIGGTVVASPDARALTPGTTSWTDSAGRTWTLTAPATISNREYRFTGETSAWPPRWDVSGTDVWVGIEASGILRRMGQGRKALDSTLRRRVPSAANLLAYWPMEEGSDANDIASSPVAGVQPLTLSRVTWASESSLPASLPLPVFNAGSGAPVQMRGPVPAPAGSPTGWQVRWVYRLDTPNTTQYTFMRILANGTVREWFLQSSSTGSRVLGLDVDGASVVDQSIGTGLDLFGQWTSVNFNVSQSGGTVTWKIEWQDVGGDAGSYTSTYTGTIGRVTAVSSPDGGFGGQLDGMAIGHIAVFSASTTTAYDGAITAYTGETALDRMSRLASEESNQLDLTWLDGDTATPSELMGPQLPEALLDLLTEAEETDGGILYERRDRAALVYRDRASLYNQPVALALNYAAKGEVPPPLEPTEDDQKVRNDITVTRAGGSSARVVEETGPLSVAPPPAGVGVYDEALTMSLANDTQPERIAAWRVHLGTVDDVRYPVITVWLHAAPHLTAAILGMDIGDRLTISNLPPWLPPGLIDQHALGYTEVLGQFDWTLTFNCSPAGPWQVGVTDDPVLGRADTAGTVLAGGMTATTTVCNVTTTTGPPWVDSAGFPAEFPFDIRVGGEVMRVTSCSGTALSQSFVVTRSINGVIKSQVSGADVRLATPMILSL